MMVSIRSNGAYPWAARSLRCWVHSSSSRWTTPRQRPGLFYVRFMGDLDCPIAHPLEIAPGHRRRQPHPGGATGRTTPGQDLYRPYGQGLRSFGLPLPTAARARPGPPWTYKRPRPPSNDSMHESPGFTSKVQMRAALGTMRGVKSTGRRLGCPLSPLLGALCLKPMDEATAHRGLFYAHFMDDRVVLTERRWPLRRAVKKSTKCWQHPTLIYTRRRPFWAEPPGSSMSWVATASPDRSQLGPPRNRSKPKHLPFDLFRALVGALCNDSKRLFVEWFG